MKIRGYVLVTNDIAKNLVLCFLLWKAENRIYSSDFLISNTTWSELLVSC